LDSMDIILDNMDIMSTPVICNTGDN